MYEKPPLYEQETDYSCVPACLRMVLEYLGVTVSEARLRELCDCMPDGTRDPSIIDAAKSFGFEQTRKYNHVDLDELKSLIDENRYPIVYVRTSLLPDQASQKHAVVVIEVSETEVLVNDPARDRYAYSREDFLHEWSQTVRLMILVQ